MSPRKMSALPKQEPGLPSGHLYPQHSAEGPFILLGAIAGGSMDIIPREGKALRVVEETGQSLASQSKTEFSMLQRRGEHNEL